LAADFDLRRWISESDQTPETQKSHVRAQRRTKRQSPALLSRSQVHHTRHRPSNHFQI
jgi:hypothetical protein